MTHSELVAEAMFWISRRWRSTSVGGHSIPYVTISEMSHSGSEFPDVIAFHDGRSSTLIECKISRADFRADKRKTHRAVPKLGMGKFRYYAAPKGIITEDDLPPGWGLLVINPESKDKRSRVVVPSSEFRERNHAAETSILLSFIRRFDIPNSGAAIRRFEMDSRSPIARFTTGGIR